MTREEAKDVFLNRGFIEPEGCRGRIFHADKWREACVVISEWLKEEPVLDKIRAEIEEDAFEDVNGSKYISVNRVNQIIDKYRQKVRKRNEF